jgi:hypothetical protein
MGAGVELPRTLSASRISKLAEPVIGPHLALAMVGTEGQEGMNLSIMLERIWGNQRFATADDIRNVFGDYHNALHWFAVFLTADEKLADACIVDACTIAETQTPTFHEWLVHWAARATVRCALQRQRVVIAELVPEYEKRARVDTERSPLSAEHFRLLIENSEDIQARLDVLCRYVLVLRGIAKDSFEKVAAQLGMSRSAVQRAYCVACDALDLLQQCSMQDRCSGDVNPINTEATVADLTV